MCYFVTVALVIQFSVLGYIRISYFLWFLLTVDSHPCEDEPCNTSDDEAEFAVLPRGSKDLQHTLSTVV